MMFWVVKVFLMSDLTHSFMISFMLLTKGVVAQQTHLRRAFLFPLRLELYCLGANVTAHLEVAEHAVVEKGKISRKRGHGNVGLRESVGFSD